MAYIGRYPINALRNLALDQADTGQGLFAALQEFFLGGSCYSKIIPGEVKYLGLVLFQQAHMLVLCNFSPLQIMSLSLMWTFFRQATFQ
jgi:hypothetical protein